MLVLSQPAALLLDDCQSGGGGGGEGLVTLESYFRWTVLGSLTLPTCTASTSGNLAYLEEVWQVYPKALEDFVPQC